MSVIGYNQSKINKEFSEWLKKCIKDEEFCLWLEKLIADERFLKIHAEVEAIDAEYERPEKPKFLDRGTISSGRFSEYG